MSTLPLVQVPQDQLDHFKRASHKLFELIARTTGTEAIPKRRGLDLFAQALGYTAHPDMVRQAPGYTTPKHGRFDLLPESVLPLVAGRLAGRHPSLSPETASDVLHRLRGMLTPVLTGNRMGQIVASLRARTDPEYDNLINPLHQAILADQTEEVDRLIRSVDWHQVESDSREKVLENLVWGGTDEQVEFLLKNGMSPNTAPRDDNTPPLAWAIVKRRVSTQKLLASYGADINKGYSGESLALLAVDHAAHELLGYCIDEGLLGRTPGLLVRAIGGDNKTVLQAYRVADRQEKTKALKRAFIAGSSYYTSLLMALDPDIALAAPIDEYLNSTPIKKLRGILRELECHPALMAKLGPGQVARILAKAAVSAEDGWNQQGEELIWEFLLDPESPWAHQIAPEHIRCTIENEATVGVILRLIILLRRFDQQQTLRVIEKESAEWALQDESHRAIALALAAEAPLDSHLASQIEMIIEKEIASKWTALIP